MDDAQPVRPTARSDRRYAAAAGQAERADLAPYNRAGTAGPFGHGGHPPVVRVRVTGAPGSTPPDLAPAVLLAFDYDADRDPLDGPPALWEEDDEDLGVCWVTGITAVPAAGSEGLGLVVDVYDEAPVVLMAGGAGGGPPAAADLYCRVVSGTNTSGYTVTRIVLTGANTFADFDPEDTFGNVYRWPTNPGVPLPDIPAGQTVVVQKGLTYSTCHPWGGQRQVFLSQVIPQLTGGSIAGEVVCVDGVPTITLAFTPAFVDKILALELVARDLYAEMTYSPPPPPPPPPPP